MARSGRWRWLKRILVGLAIILLALTAIGLWQLSGMFSRRQTDQQYALQRFRQEQQFEIGTYRALGRCLRYIRAGRKEGPRVLFVHGSPGSWRDYSGYLDDSQLGSQAQLLAFDRPGFGETSGNAETILERQAAMAAPLLNHTKTKAPTLVLGYSLGGPIAAQIAADFKEEIDGLLLIAPSIDPDLEEHRWYNWLAALPGLNYLLPAPLINSNQEIFPLKRELQKLRPKLGGLIIPTVVIQGEEDGLVPPGNADFIERLIPNTRIIRVPHVGHGILWQRRDLILQETLALLSRIAEVRPN